MAAVVEAEAVVVDVVAIVFVVVAALFAYFVEQVDSLAEKWTRN